MDEKLIIVMVGLPATGKSYITKKLSNYLQWLNIPNQIFNVGNKRRQEFKIYDTPVISNKADFFNPNSSINVQIRDQLALNTLDELLNYLSTDQGQVGIFDATNSTIKRRELIINHIDSHSKGQRYNILFLESICNDDSIVEQNILLKLNGPDYNAVANKTLALNDFKERLSNYQTVYQTVTSSELSNNEHHSLNLQYLKVINVVNLQTYNINGFIPIILNSFLQNFQISKKKIYLTLNHIDYDLLKSPLSILSNDLDSLPSATSHHQIFRISKTLTLDEIHDLILKIESLTNDTIIQSTDEFFIIGILKYFNLFNYSQKSILKIMENHMLCINPDLYTVEYSKISLTKQSSSKTNHETIMNTDNERSLDEPSDSDDDHRDDEDFSISPPIMTRSNSSVMNSNILTPIDSKWDKFNYKDLNVLELSTRLELLK